MTSGRATRNCEDGMNCILTYSDECTVPGESRKYFSEDFTRSLGEEHKSIEASQSHATWGAPALEGSRSDKMRDFKMLILICHYLGYNNDRTNLKFKIKQGKLLRKCHKVYQIFIEFHR